jgi:hypothetical protein
MESAFSLLLMAFLFFWLYVRSKANQNRKQWDQQRLELQEWIGRLERMLDAANAEVHKLSKYRRIVDAEAEAVRVRKAAEDEARELKLRAFRDADRAKNLFNQEMEAERRAISELKQQATNRKARIEGDYEAAINRAAEAAKNIVQSAEERAQQMGTYTVEQAREMGATLTAIQNQIDAYGDRYLKSSYSLLDEMAEELGHKEAGQKLKDARDVSRVLIRNDKAASCNYVASERRTTAMNFVLDAFNGKVEVILSRVKKDNYGTLEQQIKDAFQIVNTLGKAFRNAAVTDQYLSARLNELKWAVVAQELKWQEAEEQCLLREKIREEEKAQKEYEKAMRDAQKEEETLKKLIEKAQKEVQGSTDAQRARYEEKLRELEGKLKAAEEKNQRALSMAQQTKSGNVYVISNIGSFGEEVFKIGMTRRLEPLERVRELGDASVPFEFDVHALIYSDDAPRLERDLHKKFLRSQMNKVNPRKEFFRLGLSQIRTEIEAMGIQVAWTMAAEAKQYRETLALEKELLGDETKRKAWEQQQIEVEQREQLFELEPELTE